MRANRNTRAVVVGIFILIGIAILIVTILALGGQQQTFGKSITVTAVFDDVNGLQKGNNIWFSGVKIGTVKKISFGGPSQVQVQMSIGEDAAKYIRQDARARIGQEGMIGNKLIVIEAGSPQSPPIQDGNTLAVAKGTNPEEMMNTFQVNNRNLVEITNNLKLITKNITEGKGMIGKMFTDETMFIELQNTLAVLKRTAANAERMSNDAGRFASRLDDKGTLAHDVVTDTTIIPSLKRTAATLERVSTDATKLIATLNTAGNNVNTALNNTKAPAGMLLRDEKTADDIKTIMKNLQSSTKKLDENMEAMQHNFLFRGYFKRKAREAEQSKP